VEHKHGEKTHTHHHTHGTLDPALVATEQGIRAVKYSFLILAATAIFQIYIASISGSVALLADTIHNIADACTAIPLWIAFTLARRKPSRRFTYGYGRFEDLAGLCILAIIIASAVSIGFKSFERLLHPESISNIPAVIVAAIVGFAGNIIVATFRTRVGKKIKSAALIADGHHALIDSYTSLSVLFGALGVMAGFPLADTLIGLAIVVILVKIIYDAGKQVLGRMLDCIDPEIIASIERAARQEKTCLRVYDIRARWIGHELNVELWVALSAAVSILDGHRISHRVTDTVRTVVPLASHIHVHVEPAGHEHS